MGDLTGKMDRFAEGWQPNQGPSCAVGVLVAALPDDEAEALRRLFESRVFGTDIAKFIQIEVAAEHPGTDIASLAAAVKADACQRHRRGACGCG